MNTSSLLKKNTVCKRLELTPNGLARLMAKDPSMPRPIKFGDTMQSSVYFDADELEKWIESKRQAREIQS